MHKLSIDIIRCLAIGLGKREDYFDAWFNDQCSSTMRAIHYKPRDPTKEYKSILTTPEHADSGFVTLLSTFGYPGL